MSPCLLARCSSSLLFFFLTFPLAGQSCANAAAPIVSNVRAAQRPGTKFVDIYYDLASTNPPLTVTIAVSSDGGTNYSVPAASFTGDFGSGILPGSDHHVAWNAGVDWAGHFTILGRVRVTAEEGAGPAGMAFIPASFFLMGDSLDGLPDAPVHSVNVSGFWMDRFEVTSELWNEVLQWGTLHGYSIAQTAAAAGPRHPIGNINWYDVVKWCNARSEMEGRVPAYYVDATQTNVYRTGAVNVSESNVKWGGQGYRLPTEAEWEKAARGGLTGKRFPWGDDVDGSDANYLNSGDPFESNSIRSTPVGYYNGNQSPPGTDMANGYGLYDMMGNALEWCWDWYGPYSTAQQTNPRGPSSGAGRLLRGGSWGYSPDFCRTAFRYNYLPAERGYSIGFRTVLPTTSQP